MKNQYQVLLIDNSIMMVFANSAFEAIKRINFTHYQIQVVKGIMELKSSYVGV